VARWHSICPNQEAPMTDVHDENPKHARPAPAVTDHAVEPAVSRRQAQTSGGLAIDPGVARELSELARDLQAEPDPQAVMQRIVEATVHEIPAATSAAITLVHKGQVSSPAHSDDIAVRVGSIQSRTGEGPCVDTARQELTVRSDDLRVEDRWPNFAAEAVENGVLSVLSFQLFVEHDSMGALDVYSDTPNSFDADAENIGLLLAAHAAIAMSGSRKVANLYRAIESRDLIGQAKGILMERYKIDGALAFDLLILSSQRCNLKLREVAERLTSTGELAVPPPVDKASTRQRSRA
jgi:transcriptional regulator with GAF, ATPase, and Fis domain